MVLDHGTVLLLAISCIVGGFPLDATNEDVGIAPAPMSIILSREGEDAFINDMTERRRNDCTDGTLVNTCTEYRDECINATETCEQTSEQCTGGWKDFCEDSTSKCSGGWSQKCTNMERKCSGGWKNVCTKTSKQCSKFLPPPLDYLCNAWNFICVKTSKVCQGWEEVCKGTKQVCNAWEDVCNAPTRVCNAWETVCTGTVTVSCESFQSVCVASAEVCTVATEVGNGLVTAIESAANNFAQCMDDAFTGGVKNFIDTACTKPPAEISCYVRANGGSITDGFVAGCPLPSLEVGVMFGSAEEDGDKDTAIFYVDVGFIEVDVPLFKNQWVQSSLKDFLAIDASVTFNFVNDAKLTVADDEFSLSLPGVNWDFDSTLTLFASYENDPCGKSDAKCKMVLNKGRTVLLEKAFAAGPVPIVITITAEAYLLMKPKLEGSARTDIKLYFAGDGVELLSTAAMPFHDPKEITKELTKMFDPSAIVDEIRQKLRFEVAGVLEATASLDLCIGVDVGFKVNGVGTNMDIPVCLTAEMFVAADADLTGASLTVGASIYLNELSIPFELDLPDIGAVVDTACGYAKGIDTGVMGECLTAVGCITGFVDDLCDGISDAVEPLSISLDFGELTILPETEIFSAEYTLATQRGADNGFPTGFPSGNPGGAPSGTIVTVSTYALGGMGDNSCPDGYVHIVDVFECEKATAVLATGMWIEGHDGVDYGTSKPKGCFQETSDGHVYFNDDDIGGGGASKDTPLCRLFEAPDGYAMTSDFCNGEYSGDMGVYGYSNTPDVETCAAQCDALDLCVSFIWNEGTSDPCRLSYTCTMDTATDTSNSWIGFYKYDAETMSSCGIEDLQIVYIGCGAVYISEKDRDEQCDESFATKVEQVLPLTGCPNTDLSNSKFEAQLATWESQSISDVFDDLEDICERTADGTWTTLEREICCGVGKHCDIEECERPVNKWRSADDDQWLGNDYRESVIDLNYWTNGQNILNEKSCGLKRGQKVWTTECGVYVTLKGYEQAMCFDSNMNEVTIDELQMMPLIFDSWIPSEDVWVPHQGKFASSTYTGDRTVRTLQDTKTACETNSMCTAITCDATVDDSCMMASTISVSQNDAYNTWMPQTIPGALYAHDGTETSFPVELTNANKLGLNDQFTAAAWVRRTETVDSGCGYYHQPYCMNKITGELTTNSCIINMYNAGAGNICGPCGKSGESLFTPAQRIKYTKTYIDGKTCSNSEKIGETYSTSLARCHNDCGLSDECRHFYYTPDGSCTHYATCNDHVTPATSGGVYFKACTDVTTDFTIFGTDDTTADHGLHLIVRNDRYYMGFYGNDCEAALSNHLNKWEHVAFSWKGNTQKIYVNGVLVTTCTNKANFQGTGMVNIGQWASGRHWAGSIKDARIWKNALTDDEVTALFYQNAHYGQDFVEHSISAWCEEEGYSAEYGPNGDTAKYLLDDAKAACAANSECSAVTCWVAGDRNCDGDNCCTLRKGAIVQDSVVEMYTYFPC